MSTLSFTDKNLTIKNGIFHILMQIGMIIIAALILRADIMLLGLNVGEDSLTEVAQQLFLSLVVCCFVFICIINPQHRHFHLMLAGFFTCMLIRELDAFFDDLVAHGFWFYPAIVVAFFSVAYSWHGNKVTIIALSAFINHKCFYSFSSALVIVLFFSRLIGMEDLWQALMADNYVRGVKNSIEEGSELLGYSLLFCSTLIYTADMYKHKLR